MNEFEIIEIRNKDLETLVDNNIRTLAVYNFSWTVYNNWHQQPQLNQVAQTTEHIQCNNLQGMRQRERQKERERAMYLCYKREPVSAIVLRKKVYKGNWHLASSKR